MSKMLILDAQEYHYPVYQLDRLSKEFSRIFITYKQSEQIYSMDEVAQLSSLIMNKCISFQKIKDDVSSMSDLMFFAYLIGSTQQQYNEIHISSHVPDIDLLENLCTTSQKLLISIIESEETDPALKIRNSKSPESGRLTRQQINPSVPSPTSRQVQMSKPSSPTIMVKNKNRFAKFTQHTDVPTQPSMSSKSIDTIADVVIPTVEPSSYIFTEERSKEDFTKQLMDAARDNYFSTSNKVLNLDPNITDSNGSAKYLVNSNELNLMRSICLELVRQRIQKLNKDNLQHVIDKCLNEHTHLTDNNFNHSSLISKLKKCHAVERIDDMFYINRGFILFFLNNDDLGYINKTLESYDALCQHQRYCSLIDMGISLSPRDINIVSALANIVLTSPNYELRPKTTESFENALIDILSCSKTEAEFAIGLLKRYEVVNFNKEPHLIYNDPKLLRVSSLRTKSDLDIPEICTDFQEPVKTQPVVAASEPVIEQVDVPVIQEQQLEDTHEPENTEQATIPDEPANSIQSSPTTAPTQTEISFTDDVDAVTSDDVEKETPPPEAEHAPVQQIAPSDGPKEIFVLDQDTFNNFKRLVNGFNWKKLPKTKQGLIQLLQQQLSQYELGNFDAESVYNEMISKYWIARVVSSSENDDNIEISNTVLSILQASATYDEFNTRIQALIEYGVTGIAKRVTNVELLLTAIKALPADEKKWPKVHKGLLGIMTRTLGSEAQGKLMLQIMQNVRLFKMIGKRVQFDQAAMDYWRIKLESPNN